MEQPRELLMMIAALAPNLWTFRDVQLAEQRLRVTIHVRDDIRRRFRQLIIIPDFDAFTVYKYVLPPYRWKDGLHLVFLHDKPIARKYYLTGVPHGAYVKWTGGNIVDLYIRIHGDPALKI